VRRLTAVALAALVLVSVAGAAGADPKTLVLQKSDLPAGFRVDASSTHYAPNAAFPRKLVASSGRIAGYIATYEKGPAAIVSTAHLFGKAAGAHMFLAAEDAQQRALNVQRVKRGGLAYRRRSVTVGDEGALWWSKQTPRSALILWWRTGRVFASVSTWGLGADRTVALARSQQRRIENTLG